MKQEIEDAFNEVYHERKDKELCPAFIKEVEAKLKNKFDASSIAPKEKIDPNTAVIDGERYTAEEIAQEVMSEADNYEYVYNRYQDILADYARKVVANGWTGTWRDKVPFEAIKYVVSNYLGQHSTRKKNIASICRPLIAEYMQEDYDRYKKELNI